MLCILSEKHTSESAFPQHLVFEDHVMLKHLYILTTLLIHRSDGKQASERALQAIG